MVRLASGQYIIGFDNGYQFGKTACSLFDNGVHAMGKVEPSVMEHSLKYGRKYYKVGEGRAAITEDKVSDEDARLLTMVLFRILFTSNFSILPSNLIKPRPQIK